MKCTHVCATQKALPNCIKTPDFPSLADEIAEPRPDVNIKNAAFTVNEKSINKKQLRILKGVSRGGVGRGGGSGPPGKSQVIWVSIGNKQLDPLEKVGPPPSKMLDPLWDIENDRFLWNWPFYICKISWGLKKKNVVRAFLSDWPGPPLTKIPGSAHDTRGIRLDSAWFDEFTTMCNNLFGNAAIY